MAVANTVSLAAVTKTRLIIAGKQCGIIITAEPNELVLLFAILRLAKTTPPVEPVCRMFASRCNEMQEQLHPEFTIKLFTPVFKATTPVDQQISGR